MGLGEEKERRGRDRGGRRDVMPTQSWPNLEECLFLPLSLLCLPTSHTHTHTHTHADILTYTHSCSHTLRPRSHTYILRHTHTHTYTLTHTCRHSLIHTLMLTHTQTPSHTHSHTLTQALSHSLQNAVQVKERTHLPCPSLLRATQSPHLPHPGEDGEDREERAGREGSGEREEESFWGWAHSGWTLALQEPGGFRIASFDLL